MRSIIAAAAFAIGLSLATAAHAEPHCWMTPRGLECGPHWAAPRPEWRPEWREEQHEHWRERRREEWCRYHPYQCGWR